MTDFRSRFHLPPSPYLLSHSVGCQTVTSAKVLQDMYLTPWQSLGGDAWPQWLDIIEHFCTNLAGLLNGHKDDFCPQQNLSSGLTKLLQSMPWKHDRRTVLLHQDAFPSMGFVVTALKNLGFDLKIIDSSFSANDLDAWRSHLDDSVELLLVTHVHSNTGILSPVEELVKLGHDHHCYVAVDVAQSVGVVPIDLQQWRADAVLGSCVKWLCGGPGAGFLWISPELNQQCSPVDVGWFSHTSPFEFDIFHFDYHKTAKRFWGGTPSVAPYALASDGITCITDIGVDTIYAHNKTLQSLVIAEIAEHLVVPIDPVGIGGTLCLQVSEKRAQDAAKKLTEQNVFFDRRGETFRLSLHIYNGQQDVASIVDAFL